MQSITEMRRKVSIYILKNENYTYTSRIFVLFLWAYGNAPE